VGLVFYEQKDGNVTAANDMSNETYNRNFADYYDRITSHKDYVSEVGALDRHVRQTVKDPRRLLDVGCGTGHHARLLTAKGYDVTAVDLSPDMIRVAESYSSSVSFQSVDVTDLTTADFDFCYSLFNVINCLGSLEELGHFFTAIHEKLRLGGGLLVEGWNPMAVILAPPEVVERTYEHESETIVRRVTPLSDFLNQKLSLTYQIDVYPDGEQASIAKSFAVVHELVLFTPMEIAYCLERAGFKNVAMRTALPHLALATLSDRMLAVTAEK